MEDYELGVDKVMLARAPPRVVSPLSLLELAFQSVIVDLSTKAVSDQSPDLSALEARVKELKILMAAELGFDAYRIVWQQLGPNGSLEAS